MNLVPIILMTKDSSENLKKCLEDLQHSHIENNPIIIVDDCSEQKNDIKFLYEEVAKNYTIVKTPKNLSKKYRGLFAINLAFSLYQNINFCVICEDDSEFSKDFFEKLKENKDEYIFSPTKTYAIVSRKFYLKLKDLGYFSGSDLYGIGTTISLIERIASKLKVFK